MRHFLLFVFFPMLLPAQSDFLKDPDIVWAAEIEQDWEVDIPSLEEEYDEGINTIKLLRTSQNEARWVTPFLPSLVFQAAFAKKFPVFLDPKCQVKADIYKLTHYIDTLVIFDPDTYEEKWKIYLAEINPSTDIKAWRLRQILAYHKKSATWSTTVEAIAPLVDESCPNQDSLCRRPLFWFKPENKRPKLGSNDIVWAKETKNKQPQTLVLTDIKQPVKVTEGFQNPLVHLFQVMKTNSKTPFFSASLDRPLTHKERTSMLIKIDTVLTVDPETFEEKVAVVQNDINPYDIHQLRLVQSWYWDERLGRLSICLDKIAPLKDVTDEMGGFKYSVVLFYRRAKQ
jgi:hypothetical protein